MDKKQREIVNRIAKKYSLELVLLFGSQLSRQIHKESDFDVAYLSKRDLSLMEEAEMLSEFSPVFKSEKVDLTNIKKAPPLLFYGIFQNCQVLYESEPLIFPTFRAYAFKKYVETKPLYELKAQRLGERIKSTPK